jgi:endonuclease/exonuclease/phosphatase family metal-dependent hydrolase
MQAMMSATDVQSCAGESGRTVHLVLALVVTLTASAGVGRADERVAVQSGPRAMLEVASYNVQFVTPDLPLVGGLLREWPGHKPNVTARAEAIAARLACFDIVALQETINDERRRELFDRLETAGRGCGKPSRLPFGRMFAFVAGPAVEPDGPWLPLVGDELALASRFPVVATDGHIYTHAAGVDVLAAKGVVHARLARSAHDAIDVFVTHLQAGHEYGEVRRRQIEELGQFIRSGSSGGASPIVLLGDFNVRGSTVDRRDPASDYNFLRHALDAAIAPRHFVDLWLATHPADPETASGTKPRVREDGTLRPHEERIDYMFMTGSDARMMRRDFLPSDLLIDGAPVGPLSDHAALLAEVFLKDAPKAARVAASAP